MPLQIIEGQLVLTTSGGYQNFHIDEQDRLKVRIDYITDVHTLSGTKHIGQLSNTQIPDFITRDSELTAVSSTLQYQLDIHDHDDLYYRKTYLDGELQDLEDQITTVSAAIPTEHDQLNGLGDDDHPQYHNDARGDARYYTKILLDGGQLDNRYYTETEVESIVSTVSGALQTNIDGKSDIGHTHVEADITDLDKYTQAEVDNLITSASGSLYNTIITTSGSLQDDIDYVESLITSTSGAIITDHGQLDGLSDDDHPQYHNDARGDARYYVQSYIDNLQTTLQSGIDWLDDNKSDIDHKHFESDILNLDKYTQAEVDNIVSTTSGSLQTQIDGKSDIGHTHVEADITDLDKYTQSEVDSIISTTSGSLQIQIDGKSDIGHTHVEADITDLDKYTQVEVDSIISTTSGSLQTQIDGKADINHTHVEADITDLDKYTQAEVDALLTTTSGDITDQFLWEEQSGYLAPKNSSSNLRIFENVVIGGNLTVSGTQFITETEVVKVEDNIITVNHGETGAGVAEGYAGIEVDRGSAIYSRLLWDETNDYFVAGISGTEDPIALRETLPTNNYVAYWDNTNQIFSTVGSFAVGTLATTTYIDSVSGTLQTQIDGKADINHTHVEADITDLDKYTQSEVDSFLTTLSGYFEAGKADVNHTHVEVDITDLDKYTQAEVDALITASSGVSDHGDLTGLLDDDHTQYILVGGSRGFTGTVSGIYPTNDNHLVTKEYVDDVVASGTEGAVFEVQDTTGSQTIDALTTINLDSVVRNSHSSVFSLSSDEITINTDGIFLFTFRVTAGQGAGTRSRMRCSIEEFNGSTWSTITNSYASSYGRNADENGTATSIFTHEVTSGYKYRLRAETTDSDDRVTTANESFVMIFSNKGAAGPQGPAGPSDHSDLNELDYASSGHTGFASEAALTATSGTLQDQIDNLTTIEYVRFYAGSLILAASAANRPDYDDAVPVGVLSFDDSKIEYASGAFTVPDSYVSNTDIEIYLNYIVETGQTGTNTCVWELEYMTFADGEVYGSKTSTTIDLSDSLPNNASAGTFQRVTDSMADDDSNNPISAGDTITFTFGRDGTSGSDTATGDMGLIELVFKIQVEV